MEEKYKATIYVFESGMDTFKFSAELTPAIEKSKKLIDLVKYAVDSDNFQDSAQERLAKQVKSWIEKYSKMPSGWYFTRVTFDKPLGDSYVETSGYFQNECEDVRMCGELPDIDLTDLKTLFRYDQETRTKELDLLVGIGSK